MHEPDEIPADSPSPTDRTVSLLLALIPYALEHPGAPIREIADHFEVPSGRIRSALRQIALSGVPGETGTYLVQDLFDIDWDALDSGRVFITHTVGIDRVRRFTGPEFARIAAGLRMLESIVTEERRLAVESALAKLARASNAARDEDSIAAQPDPLAPRLGAIRAAIRISRSLRLDYIDAADRRTRRVIVPQKLRQIETAWYLTAYERASGAEQDAERPRERTFRVDRIVAMEEADSHRPYADHAAQTHEGDPESPVFAVTFEVDPEARGFATWYGRLPARAMASGAPFRFTADIRDISSLSRDVAQYGGAVRVLAPEEVRRAIGRWAAAARSAALDHPPLDPH